MKSLSLSLICVVLQCEHHRRHHDTMSKHWTQWTPLCLVPADSSKNLAETRGHSLNNNKCSSVGFPYSRLSSMAYGSTLEPSLSLRGTRGSERDAPKPQRQGGIGCSGDLLLPDSVCLLGLFSVWWLGTERKL